MRFFNFDSRFSATLNKLADCILLNLMWIAACLPIVTIGAASNALYEAFQIAIIRDESSIWQVFWNAFKRRIGSAILQTLIYELVLLCGLVILLAGYMYYPTAAWIGAVYLVLAILAFVLLGMAVYHFFLLRSTQLPFGKQFSVAFVLALKHLPITFLLVTLVLGMVLLAEWFLFLLLFLPALVSWLLGRYLERIAVKYPNLISREAFDGSCCAEQNVINRM